MRQTLLALILALAVAPAAAQPAPSFDKAPFVNPRIVQALSTWVSDEGNQVVAVNLTASQDSNRFFGEVTVTPFEGGFPVVSADGDDERFAYRYIGTLENGPHVLLVAEWTGGSGNFMSLMFLSEREDRGIEADRAAGTIGPGAPRRLLWKDGAMALGDRWAGELKVEGDRLFVGAAGESGSWLTYAAGATE